MRRSLFLIGWTVSFVATRAFAAGIDQAPWDALLKTYVSEDGKVNYAAIRQDQPPTFAAYLQALAQASPPKMQRAEQVSFWINAYNALAMDFIVRHPGMKKITDDFSIFDATYTVGGIKVSLHDIDARILRAHAPLPPNQGVISDMAIHPFDPRFRYALTFGAISCPSLSRTAYTADNVDMRLAEDATRFLANPKNLRIERGRLVLSSVFKWFGEDFSEAGVQDYLVKWVAASDRSDKSALGKALETRFKKADYLFDWSLNEARKK